MSKLRVEEVEDLVSGRSLAVEDFAQTFDYKAGIKITSYNQYLKDSEGALWQVKGTVELPYTTTGLGMPEGDVFVDVGDVSLRRELHSGIANIGYVTPNDGEVRALHDKLMDKVSVKDFGAIGDGVVDDSDAFEKAMSSHSAVLVPRGRYNISRPLIMTRQGATLIGVGESTVIRVTNSAGFITCDGVRQEVSHMLITCAHDEGTGFAVRPRKSGFTMSRVRIDHGAVDGTRKFENCVVIPVGAGPWGHAYYNCEFAAASSDCFLIEASSFNHGLFSHCTFRSAGNYGIYVKGASCHGNVFLNCRAENNERNGIDIAGRRGNLFTFIGTYLEHNGSNGILVGSAAPAWNSPDDFCEYTEIIGTTIWECGSSGIVINKAKGASVRGVSLGSSSDGMFSNGGIRASAPTTVSGVHTRGSSEDYALYSGTRSIFAIEDAEGILPDLVNLGGGSHNTTRKYIQSTNKNINMALGCSDIELWASKRAAGVSALASRSSSTGRSGTGAIIASSRVDLSELPENSSFNAVIASENIQLDSLAFGTVTLASRGVAPKSYRTVVGGYVNTDESSYSNVKWELESTTGNLNLAGAVSTSHTFADFAEYFENGTGEEIPLGTIVKMVGGKVYPASEGDEIIGVISATGAVVAGDTPFSWKGKYLRGDFGEKVYDNVINPDWENAESEDRESIPKMIQVEKINPDYNPESENIPRSARPTEWSCVGILGTVHVRVFEDINSDRWVGPNGLMTETKSNVKCIRMAKLYDAEVGYGVAICLIK